MDVLTFAVFVAATLVLSRILRRGAQRALDKRGVDDPGTHAIARRLIHFAVLGVGMGTAVTNLGFNLSAIFAAGAVLGVGIGFAFQNVAQNFISGLLLLFERSIKLERAAGEAPWRVKEKEPLVLMTAFGDSSVNFEVSVWIDDPWRSRRALSDLHEAVWWALKEDHIVIAFPQLDVHFDGALHERLDRFPRAS